MIEQTLTIEDKLKILGDEFLGLWKTGGVYQSDGKLVNDNWQVAIIHNGRYVETPDMASLSTCLDCAINLVKKPPSKKRSKLDKWIEAFKLMFGADSRH